MDESYSNRNNDNAIYTIRGSYNNEENNINYRNESLNNVIHRFKTEKEKLFSLLNTLKKENDYLKTFIYFLKKKISLETLKHNNTINFIIFNYLDICKLLEEKILLHDNNLYKIHIIEEKIVVINNYLKRFILLIN